MQTKATKANKHKKRHDEEDMYAHKHTYKRLGGLKSYSVLLPWYNNGNNDNIDDIVILFQSLFNRAKAVFCCIILCLILTNFVRIRQRFSPILVRKTTLKAA